MENAAEAGDDHGSGWMLVKKKHRSNSKSSLHGWVGGVSEKQDSDVVRSHPSANVKPRTSNSNRGRQPLSSEKNCAGHCPSSVTKSEYAPSEDEKDVRYLDKCVVGLDNQCADSPVQGAINGNRSDSKTGSCQELPHDNNDFLPRIRWGNLDGALVPPCKNISGSELIFGHIGNDDLVTKNTEDAVDRVACTSACMETKENKYVVTALESDQVIQEPYLPSTKNKHASENCEEVKEEFLKDVEVQITCEEVASLGGDVSCKKGKVTVHEQLMEVNETLLNSSAEHAEIKIAEITVPVDHEQVMEFNETLLNSSAEHAEIKITEITVPVDLYELVQPEVSDVSVVLENLNRVVEPLVPESDPRENTRLEIQQESALTSVDESRKPQEASIFGELSKAQIINSIAAGDAGESKERFRQRLWCFLFENLNRAVDELYLLCELECDKEQMKEAILVLEEAASDFKELKFRVEEFENVNGSHLLNDETRMPMKSEHRRQHALSWEVRRMTTSPRRAGILSSSLEAFKRIQEERVTNHAGNDSGYVEPDYPNQHRRSSNTLKKHAVGSDEITDTKEPAVKPRKQNGASVLTQGSSREKRNVDTGRPTKTNSAQNGRFLLQNQSASDSNLCKLNPKNNPAVNVSGMSKRDLLGTSETEKVGLNRVRLVTEGITDKNLKSVDNLRRQSSNSERDERDKDKRSDMNGISFKSMDAWNQKRNWEDILASPLRVSSRFSHSPGMSRKSAERARNLRDKLMSPEKKKKTALDLKKEADEKHARAMRIRSELENERVQRLQRSSDKLNRVNEWQAVRSSRLREGMHARQLRSESRHEAHLAQVVRRAGDESSKVNEVRFITSLNEENKKLMLLQKHQDSDLRRAEKLKDMKTKQKEDMAREEAVLERKKLIEAEKLQRLAETQRRKEEAQLRREEERKASSAAREAKAMEQIRRKEVRAKAQQEEAELLAQKLAERLSESEQRRKFYLEQIRERASMDFRDQSSPLPRRSVNKEVQGRLTLSNSGDHDQSTGSSCIGGATIPGSNLTLQHSLKRRIKKIRQRLMALKYELPEFSVGSENTGIGYRAAIGTARAKIGRWLQDLQRHRQARKEGAASIGLVTAEIIKFLEGKEPELQASRQAGLLDFIASALPASHTSKPEACQVTMYLLRLLRVALSLPANRSYFIAQNLLPPIIPMLAAALENFIKIAASSNAPGSTSLSSSKTLETLDSISEVLDGFLWTVAVIIGHMNSDERQLQMQDGLLELVIAYQVIHRLRDLFALYDRPQVEGSPFPSSILLSINLLVILTSKFRTMSSIDWESFPIEIMPAKVIQDAELVDAANLGGSFCHLNENMECPLSAVIEEAAQVLQDVPEDRSLDESSNIKDSGESMLVHEKECGPHEFQGNSKEDIMKPTIPKEEENSVGGGAVQKTGNKSQLKKPVVYLLSAVSETGLICLPSLLTAVLLQANNRLSSEQTSYVLPSNFEEVATGVLKVLNNLALMDVNFIQMMLARADLKMELFHIMSFLLSHCTSKWGVASDQTGLLLFECLSLLSYFALFHPENQAVLRWGKSPTILHKVCDLPFVFFSDPELMPVLAGTLVATCFGCEQNRGVIQQELSTDMLLSLLKSCQPLTPDNPLTDESIELTQLGSESKKHQNDIPRKLDRLKNNARQSIKGGAFNSSTRSGKARNAKDGKVTKVCEEIGMKQNLLTSETSSNLMLYSRFPSSLISRAEQFFSAELAVHVEV